MKTNRKAHAEGKKAFMDNKTLADNPHLDPVKSKSWAKGWIAGIRALGRETATSPASDLNGPVQQ